MATRERNTKRSDRPTNTKYTDRPTEKKKPNKTAKNTTVSVVIRDPQSKDEMKRAAARRAYQAKAKAGGGGKLRAATYRPPRSDGRGFLNDTSPGNQAGTGVMIIPTVLRLDTLYIAAATMFSNLIYRNVGAANEQFQYDIVNGLSYLVDSIKVVSEGATLDIGQLPFIFDVILALLKEKTVKFQTGAIKYTPTWSGAVSLPLSFNTPTNATFTFIPPGNNPTVPINFGVTSPSSDAYSAFLRVIGDPTFSSNFGSRVVDQGSAQGLCVVDPSAYARVYTYFGTAGSLGGFYSVCEIEVPSFFPMFSRFVDYNRDDKVISRVFHPQTGGISLPVGLSITTDCNMNLLKNPIPCQYKFIDFTQFYGYVASYVAHMMNNIAPNMTGITSMTKPTQFTFSALDFAWLLRQSVLSMFPEQCHGQFVTPLDGSPSSQNVFEPFICDSVVSPNPISSGLMLPAFIVENLSMLRGFTVPVTSTPNSQKYGTKPTKLAHTWMPVWGIYSGDTLPMYTFYDNTLDANVPCFNPIDQLPVARLYDGITAASALAKLNVNEYVAVMKAEFNEFINGFSKARSVPVSPVTSDLKSKTNLLSYTRVLQKFDLNDPKSMKVSAVPENYKQPAYGYMLNGPQKKLVKEDSLKNVKGKKNIEAIPPAALGSLYQTTILSHRPLGLNVVGALDYFILPCIRLNPEGVVDEDLLTVNAYQTVTGELCQQNFLNGTFNPTSPNEFLRIFTSAAVFNAGFAPGSSTNDTLTDAVKLVSQHAQGIDFLKSLFGGLASVIPVVGPILSGLIGGS